MKISIVTPVLKGGRFIEAAIRSIQSQHLSDWEQIIVDGGSTDDTRAKIANLAAHDGRVQLIEKPGCTQYEAITLGFERARGDIIAWLNADDLYTPWAFSTVVERLGADPDVRWVTGFPSAWNAAGELASVKPLAWWPQRWIAAGLFQPNGLGYLQQESMFFRRSLFTELTREQQDTFCNADLAGDYYLWRQFAEQTALHAIPTVLGGFRRHGANRSDQRADAYLAEVMSWKPQTLPGLLRPRLRALFLTMSAHHASRLALAADGATA